MFEDPYSSCMQIVVNGESRKVQGGASVADLVKELGLDRSACAVELNRELVPKKQHADRVLSEGDRVEVVTLVGGG